MADEASWGSAARFVSVLGAKTSSASEARRVIELADFRMRPEPGTASVADTGVGVVTTLNSDWPILATRYKSAVARCSDISLKEDIGQGPVA